MPNALALAATARPILPIPNIPSLDPVNCFPNKKSADHFQFFFLTHSVPSFALLAAPKRTSMAISAVASVKTSGVFVTAIFLFFARSTSIFPKPTAKFEIILTLFENFEIVSASNL